MPISRISLYHEQRTRVPGILLVSEATVVSPRHGGYPNVPGIYSDYQVVAWKDVTGAVHRKRADIYPQLWVLGRAAYPASLNHLGYPLL